MSSALKSALQAPYLIPAKQTRWKGDLCIKRAEGDYLWQLPLMTRLDRRAQGLPEDHVATSSGISHICLVQR